MTTQQEKTARLYRSDLATFTQIRGLSGINESWERVVAVAEQALSHFEDSQVGVRKWTILRRKGVRC